MIRLVRSASVLSAAFLASVSSSGYAGAAVVKPLLSGLVSVGDTACLNQASNTCVPDNSLSDAFSQPGVLYGYVINVNWAQLQPTSPLDFKPAVIDQALTNIRKYNTQNPTRPLRAILRVAEGRFAPNWVKALDGGPVVIADRANPNLAITVPYFWSVDNQSAWRALQDKLASKYDAEPLIAEVSSTSCSHESSEPYVNPTDSGSIVALFRAGYTNQSYAACLSGSVQDYDAWTTTPVDFTQNEFENLSLSSVNGQVQGEYGPLDLKTTTEVMASFRAHLGQRAILANHNLTYPILAVDTGLYTALTTLGRPLEFQTAAPGITLPSGATTGKLLDWGAAIAAAVRSGAGAVEVWPSKSVGNNPITDGWNPMACKPAVPASECGGQPVVSLQLWNGWLQTGLVAQ